MHPEIIQGLDKRVRMSNSAMHFAFAVDFANNNGTHNTMYYRGAHTMHHIIRLCLIAFALSGCQHWHAKTHTPAQAAAQARQIYADFFEEYLRLNPLLATRIGDHRFNDRVPNFLGAAHRRNLGRLNARYLQRIRRVPSELLQGDDLISHEMFIEQRQNALAGARFPEHLLPLNQFYSLPNMIAMLGSGQQSQPFNSVEDYDNWLHRARDFLRVMDQAILNMREGMRRDITQPKVLMRRVLAQLQELLQSRTEESLFYQPVAHFPEAVPTQERVRLQRAYRRLIEQDIVPNFKRMQAFIRDEYLPACRDSHGMQALPDGRAWYAFNVRRTTTTDYTPETIHALGLSEVARIHAAMHRVMQRMGFNGTLAEFFRHTRDDPRFHFDSRADMLAAYNALKPRARAAADRLFSLQPKADFEIRLVEPFRERSASSASYQAGAADGSRAGIFYINGFDLQARPTWSVESLYLHEAVPGHHFQIMIQQEMHSLPKFRQFGGITAFSEGWGLYAESIGDEMGFYQQPIMQYGALSAELWRAIRLVVDTGIHHYGWSRQQVLDYMYANAPVAEARAVSEAERFMALPGQALAYKVGQLKISALRARAEARLGDDFDVREFHAEVLGSGALPLSTLEKKINRWIDSQP